MNNHSTPSRWQRWIFGISLIAPIILSHHIVWTNRDVLITHSYSPTLFVALTIVVTILAFLYAYFIFRRFCKGDYRVLSSDALIRYFPTSRSESTAALAAVFFVFFIFSCGFLLGQDPLWLKILLLTVYGGGFIASVLYYYGRIRESGIIIMACIIFGTALMLFYLFLENVGLLPWSTHIAR